MKQAARKPTQAPRRPRSPVKSRTELAEILFQPKRGGHAFRKRRSFPER